MSNAVCVIYVKNAKNAKFDAHAISLMSYLYMALWVSKDASGPQDWCPRPLNDFLISLMAQNFKMLTFKIFLCIFWNFLCIIERARGGWNIKGRKLNFFLVTPDTQFNGKKQSANSDSNFLDFWPPLLTNPT